MQRIAVYLLFAILAAAILLALGGCKTLQRCPCDCTTPVDRPCDMLTTGP